MTINQKLKSVRDELIKSKKCLEAEQKVLGGFQKFLGKQGVRSSRGNISAKTLTDGIKPFLEELKEKEKELWKSVGQLKTSLGSLSRSLRPAQKAKLDKLLDEIKVSSELLLVAIDENVPKVIKKGKSDTKFIVEKDIEQHELFSLKAKLTEVQQLAQDLATQLDALDGFLKEESEKILQSGTKAIFSVDFSEYFTNRRFSLTGTIIIDANWLKEVAEISIAEGKLLDLNIPGHVLIPTDVQREVTRKGGARRTALAAGQVVNGLLRKGNVTFLRKLTLDEAFQRTLNILWKQTPEGKRGGENDWTRYLESADPQIIYYCYLNQSKHIVLLSSDQGLRSIIQGLNLGGVRFMTGHDLAAVMAA